MEYYRVKNQARQSMKDQVANVKTEPIVIDNDGGKEVVGGEEIKTIVDNSPTRKR
jgi:hypothetical protein